MSSTQVDKIADAVLYEGYVLYPYRASSRKNRSRFTFGRVYPRSYSITQTEAEPFATQTECLLRRGRGEAVVDVRALFLQPISREVALLAEPLKELDSVPENESFRIVPEVHVDGRLYQSWQEAAEREVQVTRASVASLRERVESASFSFPASSEVEPVRDRDGLIRAFIWRRSAQIEGIGTASSERIDDWVYKITVTVANLTHVERADAAGEKTILLKTFASTHMILAVSNGEFLSLLDPPPAYSSFAANCKNIGAWPVLVGEKTNGGAATMLSSPIILYDFPTIAPESPGPLFDGTEIDEILTLRVLTMTDEEKSEMDQLDKKTHGILERTELLSKEQLLGMHGEMRKMASFDHGFFAANTRPKIVTVQGTELQVGDRVIIRPKGRADVMDIALEGKIAVIESIEQDAEDRVYLALVLDEDPGRDLGLARQPGHRFFYGVNEVEPFRSST
jgi:hydrogenase maturation protease